MAFELTRERTQLCAQQIKSSRTGRQVYTNMTRLDFGKKQLHPGELRIGTAVDGNFLNVHLHRRASSSHELCDRRSIQALKKHRAVVVLVKIPPENIFPGFGIGPSTKETLLYAALVAKKFAIETHREVGPQCFDHRHSGSAPHCQIDHDKTIHRYS